MATDSTNQCHFYDKQREPLSHKENSVVIRCCSKAKEEGISQTRNFIKNKCSSLNPSTEFSSFPDDKFHFYNRAEKKPLEKDKNKETEQSLEKDFSSIKNENKETVKEILEKVYRSKNGDWMILANRIVCKYKSDTSQESIEKINKRFSLKKVKELKFLEKTFLLEISETRSTSSSNAVEICDKLSKEECVSYAHPDWIERINLHSAAPSPQSDLPTNEPWYLKKIKAQEAWKELEGVSLSNVKIAIIDEGFYIGHEDLKEKVIDSIDLDNGDNDPSGSFSHGTSCAGVAVRTDGGLGSLGIAPNCQIIPIKASLDWFTGQYQLAEALLYAFEKGADIISCSFGKDEWELLPVLKDAIDKVTNDGRGGRGCLVFWAGGEQGGTIDKNEIATCENVIAVGSTRPRGGDLEDGRTITSPQGKGLDLVAPGTGIITLAKREDGDSNLHKSGLYRYFNGTSAATPLVAGVAALILGVNPKLTREEVQDILFETADKIGKDITRYKPVDGDRRRLRNDKYGYGRVNALKAVKKAINTTATKKIIITKKL
ncbi:MAG: S8 family serine peptidase [Acidobacteria bacterium]|nr:S8 family serine peptidase [Acidobacteriota bacterium]